MYTAIIGGNHDKYVIARDCDDRTLDYRCPECGSKMILKKGAIKTPHFAHKDNFLDCAFGKNESESHLKTKDFLYQLFKNNGDKVYAEYKVKDKDSNRYIFADIYVVPKGTDMPIAIEILTKNLTVNDIKSRIDFYSRNNIAVLWVHDSAFYDKMKKNSEFKVSEPAKYLYRYYYNILYVFTGNGIMACKIDNAVHHTTGGYDSYGDYHEPSEYTCKTIYTLRSYDDKVDLTKDFSRNRKEKYGNLPEGYIYRLKYDKAKML